MSFLESVFSFVFGDGDPNREFEDKRWQMVSHMLNLHIESTLEYLVKLLIVRALRRPKQCSWVVSHQSMQGVPCFPVDRSWKVLEDADFSGRVMNSGCHAALRPRSLVLNSLASRDW